MKLFDIALCKCASLRLCKCDNEKCVPSNQHSFLVDQRSSRRMKLKIKPSLQISNCQKRVSKPSSFIDLQEIPCDFSLDSIDSNECGNDTNCPTTRTPGISLRSRFIEVEYGNENENGNDNENENEHQSQAKYNTVKMYELAKIADRYNVSD